MGLSKIDGILGRDVMYPLKSVINMNDKTFKLKHNNAEIILKIQERIEENTENTINENKKDN